MARMMSYLSKHGQQIFVKLIFATVLALAASFSLHVAAQDKSHEIGQKSLVVSAQNPHEKILTRRGLWIYQWRATPNEPSLKAGDIETFHVRYFSDGSYLLSVKFAGVKDGAHGEMANNKGLWALSKSLYSAIITEGPNGPLSTPAVGLIATVKSISAQKIILQPLGGGADLVLVFQQSKQIEK